MKNKLKNNIFISTTALDLFWDKSAKKIIFLGEWCKTYIKPKYKNLNVVTLNYIWEDKSEIEKGIKYCENVYHKVLKKLIEILNEFHNIKKNYRYWDLLLKPWLYVYIQVIYDKYRHLKLANKIYKDIYTFTINNKYYQYISTNESFINNLVNNDEYNLQLYSQISKFLNIKYIDIDYKIKYIETGILSKSSLKEKLLRNVTRILNKLFNKNNILIVSPYFKNNSLKKILELSIKSNFLFVFDNLKYDILLQKNINLHKRKELFTIDNEYDEFISLLFDTFIYNFPIIYFEAYQKFNTFVKSLPISKSKIIYSANALYTNEIFKFYVAEQYNKLKRLYGQHGGGIGIDKINIPEIIERSFADIYYTYGWIENSKTRVLPLSKLKIKKSNKNNISYSLLVMTTMPRYFYRFTYLEDSSKMLDYINNTKNFLSNFSKLDNLIIRPYMQDYGWSIKERLLEVNKNLKFDNTTNYYKQISKAKLVIFDHMHTGYLETLSANIPTIIFIPKNIYCFRDSAKPYIQKLKDVQILFEDPIEAANFVEKIYDDIDTWWNSNKVQKAKEEFCYRYARTSENWVDEWIKEFNRVLNEKNMI